MTATLLRMTRRVLDGLLLVAVIAVALVGGLTLAAPSLGGTTLIIGGGSMEPAIPRGAYVLTVRTSFDDLRVGDVITVQEGGHTPFTHRITRFATLPAPGGSARYVETKGDANENPDRVLIPETGILGRVELALPMVGVLAALLATPLGLVGFLACCLAIVTVVWLLEEVEDRQCRVCARIRAAVATPRLLLVPAGGMGMLATAGGKPAAGPEAGAGPSPGGGARVA